jgi:hypothetical protein
MGFDCEKTKNNNGEKKACTKLRQVKLGFFSSRLEMAASLSEDMKTCDFANSESVIFNFHFPLCAISNRFELRNITIPISWWEGGDQL